MPIWHPHTLGQLVPHPTSGARLLASTLSSRCYTAETDGLCFKNLLYSSDFGETWRTLQEYVVMYDWARALKTHALEYPEDAVFATVHAAAHRDVHQVFGKWDHRVDLVVSRDLFATPAETLVPRGNRFLFTERYIAVAAVAPAAPHGARRAGTDDDGGGGAAAPAHAVELVLSSDGGHRWHGAELEFPMTQHSYTILDTSNDAVFLHVNHDGEHARWGNVYLSNSLGTNFSLSLPHNRRDANGKADFEKLQSMEGVYIANYYENVDALEAYARERGMGQSLAGSKHDGDQLARADDPPPPDEEIRTVITFDRGASWEYLVPPTEDALGEKVDCASSDHPLEAAGPRHCSLHLHGITDVFGPFYSAPSAVGLMMATGNIGAELTFREGLINTYFSRDGGHAWFEVAKGSHIYEFGDHGAIILMANDEVEVTDVLYTWNEGLTWESLRFTEHPVLVDNIMTEPRGNSKRFVIYGTRADPADPDSGVRTGVLFAVDFGELHERACVGEGAAGSPDSDFERWAPSATAGGDACLMGRRVEYTRRKRERACYNADAGEISHFVANCECADRDWECDRGYKRTPIDGGVCVRDAAVPVTAAHLVPHYCRPGLNYHVSNGYRKVAGDSCAGGVQHAMALVPCPGSAWHHSVSHGGWTALLLLLALAGALAGLTFCQLQLQQQGGPRKGGGGGGGGDALPSAAAARIALLPVALRRPAAVLLGVAGLAAAAAWAAAAWLAGRLGALLGRGRGAGAGGKPERGNIASSGGADFSSSSSSSSRGAGGAAAYSGVAYGQVGSFEDNLDSAADDGAGASRSTRSGSGGPTRRGAGGGAAGTSLDDDEFGLDGGDDDAAGLLHVASVIGGGAGSAAAADLLGLGDPLGASSSAAAARAAAAGGASTPVKVPTLRPPRSHEGKKA